MRGRVPVVFLHWAMADCAHCDALPAFLRHAVDIAVAAGMRTLDIPLVV